MTKMTFNTTARKFRVWLKRNARELFPPLTPIRQDGKRAYWLLLEKLQFSEPPEADEPFAIINGRIVSYYRENGGSITVKRRIGGKLVRPLSEHYSSGRPLSELIRLTWYEWDRGLTVEAEPSDFQQYQIGYITDEERQAILRATAEALARLQAEAEKMAARPALAPGEGDVFKQSEIAHRRGIVKKANDLKRDGKTWIVVADELGVSERNLRNWRHNPKYQ